jgi:hypothetical protein
MFEAETMNVCPLDFIRVNIKFWTDFGTEQLFAGVSVLLPNLSFKINPIQPLKIVSTPLSRLLLGKQTADDKEHIQTNFEQFAQGGKAVASGFISLDSDKRIYPLMPQDPLLAETAIVGLWMWGVSDLR